MEFWSHVFTGAATLTVASVCYYLSRSYTSIRDAKTRAFANIQDAKDKAAQVQHQIKQEERASEVQILYDRINEVKKDYNDRIAELKKDYSDRLAEVRADYQHVCDELAKSRNEHQACIIEQDRAKGAERYLTTKVQELESRLSRYESFQTPKGGGA